MGGSIEVTDDAQGNEKIYFELDVREGSVQPAETRVSHRSLVGTNNGEPIRVLVADDAEENCIVFSEILGHFGFDVRTVEDGREAVRVYEEWKPHIIMMDLRMPGMDGYEAAKMIRAKEDGQDPVIFAATGDVLESDVEKIRESGMDGYILKPYDERSIREKIGEFIKLSNALGRTDAVPFKDAVPENGSISELPHGIVEKMQDAARNARLDILLEAVDESEEYNKSIAQRMRDLIKKYDYESIFEILGIKQ
jgi:CheY-like chemotaxis protein